VPETSLATLVSTHTIELRKYAVNAPFHLSATRTYKLVCEARTRVLLPPQIPLPATNVETVAFRDSDHANCKKTLHSVT
jgi:hypothetical protein